MRFAFIHTEKARCTVQALCRALDVSPSGFYAWCRQPESAHAQRDRQLRVLIRASHEASRYRYGSPRVHEDLIEQGVPISRKRVVRLMRAEGLTARVRKRFKCGSPDIKVGLSPGRSDQELCDLGRKRLIHGFFWDLPEQCFLASVDGRLRRPRSGC